MMYYVRCRDGQRWKVREALSLNKALNCIAHAKVLGSVGSKDTLTKYDSDLNRLPTITLADVVQVNSDNSERQPYTEAY